MVMVSSVPTTVFASRSSTSRPGRQPFRRTSTLEPYRRTSTLELGLSSDRVHGPVPFLNPTRAKYTQVEPAIPEIKVPPTSTPSQNEDPAAPTRNTSLTGDPATSATPTLVAQPTGLKPVQPALTYQWMSRNSRKGRRTLLIDDIDNMTIAGFAAPEPTSTFNQVMRNIGLIFTSFPIWDISFDVAILFTVGSAVWVLNGFFNLLPYTNPSSAFRGEVLYVGGITAFIGILIFALGGYFLVLEAINEDRADCFG